MYKSCSKCKIDYLLSEFSKGKAQCKNCISVKNKNWRFKNKEKIKIKNKLKWQANKLDPLYREKMDAYYLNNKKSLLEQKKKYYQKNKNEILRKHKLYEQKQSKINPLFRMRKNIRRRLLLALNGKFKNETTISLIGCSWDFLVKYLESKFKPGMTWSNYGYNVWHIDHIIPVSKFDISNPEELKKCMHYTNLQPLWANENLNKGNRFIFQ